MAENSSFLAKLEASINLKYLELEEKQIPVLQDQFRIYHTSYRTIFKILLNKGLIQEDQYAYEMNISEIITPSTEPFTENERFDQLSQRMTAYDAILDFLNNYFSFSVDFLDLKRLKALLKLINYFRWEQLSVNVADQTTRVLVELVGRIKSGTDMMSINLINDSHQNMLKNIKSIKQVLKELSEFQKENFKLSVRKNIIPHSGINERETQSNPEEALRKVKKAFARENADGAFYSTLVQEIFDEDYSIDSKNLQQKVLDKLIVKEGAKDNKDAEKSYKTLVLEAVRLLATANLQLEDTVRKLSENAQILANRKISFSERFKQWLIKLVNKDSVRTYYDIELYDPSTSASITERLDFDDFIANLHKKAQLFANLSNRNSVSFQRLSTREEDKIYEFLSRQMEEMHLIQKRLAGLSDFFNTSMPRAERGKLRGIKLEMNAIKNSVVKANQKKHEYAAFKEEEEQMKRLGIKS